MGGQIQIHVHEEDDLWLEILKRLPVKSLCRFRCVCKSWNSLLSSPFFITFHHKFMVSVELATNQKSYLMLDQLERSNIPGYALYLPHLRQCHAGGGDSDCLTNMGLPFPVPNLCEFRSRMLLDVIHGVVCIIDSFGEKHIVWNPTTHKYISLPNQKYGYEDRPLYLGFGFSAAKSDFKMVVLLSPTPYYDLISVQEGLWRRKSLGDALYQGYTPVSMGFFVNGTIYWVAARLDGGDLFCMLLFDCEREEFRAMECPELGGIRRVCGDAGLFKFGDKLALLRKGDSSQLPLELWVMEQEQHTWKQLFARVDNVFDQGPSLVNHDILIAEDGSIFATGRNDLSSVDLPFDSGTLHQPLNGLVFRESLLLMDVVEHSNQGSSDEGPQPQTQTQTQRPRQCQSDGKVYFGCTRFRVSQLVNFCLDVAAKLMASA